jgi:hypothetical protein
MTPISQPGRVCRSLPRAHVPVRSQRSLGRTGGHRRRGFPRKTPMRGDARIAREHLRPQSARGLACAPASPTGPTRAAASTAPASPGRPTAQEPGKLARAFSPPPTGPPARPGCVNHRPPGTQEVPRCSPSPATAASPATSPCAPRTPARPSPDLGRQRPRDRNAEPVYLDLIVWEGPGQGRRRAPRNGPGRQLLRTPQAAPERHQHRRPPRRARAPWRRHRVLRRGSHREFCVSEVEARREKRVGPLRRREASCCCEHRVCDAAAVMSLYDLTTASCRTRWSSCRPRASPVSAQPVVACRSPSLG